VTITVEFRRTANRDFARALQVAQGHPSFTATPPPVRFRVRYTQEEVDACQELVSLVGGWSQTRLFLGDRPVEAAALTRWLACYRARLAAPDRRAYCQGGEVHETRVGPARQLFPCRLIPISEGNLQGWFHYGRLTRDGVFVVDKGLLRQAVGDAARRTLAEHCPAYFPAEVDAVVDRLPARIDPRREPQWTYREGWVEGRFVPVGVEKRAREAAEATGRTAASGELRQAGEPVRVDPSGSGSGAPPPAPGPRGAPAGPAPERRQVPAVRYGDVGGLARPLRVIRENLELPLRHPELFAHLGVEPHRGLLLAGPPGTGKTLLAKALATECRAHFCFVNGPEILSKWHGESEANLRRVFEEAHALAPSVVLIDEIDSIAPDRARVSHHHESVLVSQLLTLLDGLWERGVVVVVGTTNRPELVDPALRRPGRLDLLLEIGLPDAAAREEILRIHTARMPLAEDVDLAEWARRTEGFAGAHLGSLCREAGMACMREVLEFSAEGDFLLPGGAVDRLRVRRCHFEQALPVVAPRLAPAATPFPPACPH
jgi:hypothetical protein